MNRRGFLKSGAALAVVGAFPLPAPAVPLTFQGVPIIFDEPPIDLYSLQREMLRQWSLLKRTP